MKMLDKTVNGVVYLLTSPSGKCYVGQSWCYENRMSQYRRGEGAHAIGAAIAKYSWDNFTATIIKRGIETQEALDAAEDAFIVSLNTMSPNGYNMRSGGKGGKHSAETRAKMSDAQRGRSLSAETRAKIGDAQRGRPKSEEHRAKIGASNRKPETRARIGNAHRGKPLSAEHRAKISAVKQGHVVSTETRAKLRASHLGKTMSSETRAKISATLRGHASWSKGKTLSPETRAKMSASAKARWARKRQTPRGVMPL